jgi:hypothetical protein
LPRGGGQSTIRGGLDPAARNATAMLAKLKTFSLLGIDALPVKVEV